MPIANTCSIGYPHDGRADNAAYSPFLHYRLAPSFKKINIGNTGNQNPPEGGCWLPVFPILIFVSRKPADNAKMVNRHDRRADNAAYRHDRRADSLSLTKEVKNFFWKKTTFSSFLYRWLRGIFWCIYSNLT